MAKATVIRGQPINPPVKSVVLELTRGEAEVLKYLCGSISGKESGPRGVLSEIWRALGDVDDISYDIHTTSYGTLWIGPSDVGTIR